MTNNQYQRFIYLNDKGYYSRTFAEDEEFKKLEVELVEARMPINVKNLGEVATPSTPKILKARAVRTHNGLLMVNEFGNDEFLLHLVPNNGDGAMLWVSKEELGAWANAIDTVSTKD